VRRCRPRLKGFKDVLLVKVNIPNSDDDIDEKIKGGKVMVKMQILAS
jgi:hypothetical protein